MLDLNCAVDVLIEDFNSIKSINFAFVIVASNNLESRTSHTCRFKLEGSKCSVHRPTIPGGLYRVDFETVLLAVPFDSERLNATVVKKSVSLSLPYYYFPDWDPALPFLSLPCSQLNDDWKIGREIKDLYGSALSPTSFFSPACAPASVHMQPIFHSKVYFRLPYQHNSNEAPDRGSVMSAKEVAELWKDSLFHHCYAKASVHNGDEACCNVLEQMSADSVEIGGLSVSIFCSHCQHELVCSGKKSKFELAPATAPDSALSLRWVRRLPSGVFDLMMYSFMCCEEQSALSTSDVAVPTDTILSGILSLILHPQQFSSVSVADIPLNEGPPSVQMRCKVHNSCLDMVLGNTAATGSNVNLMGVPARDVNDHIKLSGSMLNIDTCRVLCAVCSSYLGDGVFNTAQDSSDAGAGCDNSYCRRFAPRSTIQAATPAVSTDADVGTGVDIEHAAITLSDLSSIRLIGSSISLSFNGVDREALQKCALLSVEQMVARLLYKISAMSGLVHYFLYPEVLHFGALQRQCPTGDNEDGMFGIYIKLLTRDYQLSGPETNAESSLRELSSALRVEYCIYDITRSLPKSLKTQFSITRRCLSSGEVSSADTTSSTTSTLLAREALHIPLSQSDMRSLAATLQLRYALFNAPDDCDKNGNINYGNALLLV